jgi:hypothetical protein
MRHRFRIIAVFVMALAFSQTGLAKSRVASLDAAYKILIAYAREHHLTSADRHPGAYYCDYAPKRGPWFVVCLHYKDETVDEDWVGSDSVGCYGVNERNGSIIEWNAAQDIPGKKMARP